jgi:SAM-dependent methyltransferase
LAHPSLEVGVADGASSYFMHLGRGRIDYGGDMPAGSTYESLGFHIEYPFRHYGRYVGMDVSELPFRDRSFHTFLSSEVLFYGMDLDRTLDEVFRVLAPGGCCAIATATEGWYQYPGLLADLRRVIPSFHAPPAAWWRNALERRGFTDIVIRPFMPLAFGITLAAFMGGFGANAVVQRFIRLLREDSEVDGFYTRMLDTMVQAIKNDLVSTAPGECLHFFIAARKPGTVDPSLRIPEPRCLRCHGEAFTVAARAHTCLNCGASYQRRMGIPIMLSSRDTAYSPRDDVSPSQWESLEHALYEIFGRLKERLTGPIVVADISELGFLIERTLAAHGAQVAMFFDPASARFIMPLAIDSATAERDQAILRRLIATSGPCTFVVPGSAASIPQVLALLERTGIPGRVVEIPLS